MSRPTTISYQCPNCANSSDVTIWQSVNVTVDPNMREQVLNNKAYTFVCPSCDFHQQFAYTSLYHDMEQQFMIYWIPDADEASLKDVADLDVGNIINNMKGYRLRIVPTLDRLKEKILIFGHQLDDRAVELLKLMMWPLHLEKKGLARDQIYFESANMDTENPELNFVGFSPSGQGTAFSVSGKNGYSNALDISNMYIKKTRAQETQQWEIIDHTYWDFLTKREDKRSP